MKILNWNDLNSDEKNQALQRPALSVSEKIESIVSEIIRTVRKNGDQALIQYGEKLDGVTLSSLNITAEELTRELAKLNEKELGHLKKAYTNIKKFHRAQLTDDISVEVAQGIQCRKKSVPIERVGLYLPGGTAPLFSSLLMMAIPAKLAGCREIIVCTPPSTNGVNRIVKAVCALCEVDQVFQVGGAQAIAAMAYGTESIPKVDKIFGPGNAFVAMAKQLCSLDSCGAAIDLPAGPSEVMVIADENANPNFIAADLLSQAEHGPDSQVIGLFNSDTKAQAVSQSIIEICEKLPRLEIVKASLEHARLIVVDSDETAIKIANQYAPEHLIINTKTPETISDKIIHAGSVFEGAWSPESVGDYASGTNHVLPTYGHAKAYSGLGLAQFSKTITFQKLSKRGLSEIGETVMWMANEEGLTAHEYAVKVRLENES